MFFHFLFKTDYFCFSIFPESPRWLVAQGRIDEAQVILEKFGGKNDKPIDKQRLRSLLEKVRDAQLIKQDTVRTYHISDLFKTTRLRRFTLIVSFGW